MEVEYDRAACNGWFQCVQEWDAFDINMQEDKAELSGASESEDGVYVRQVPADAEAEAKAAAEACPVDAIVVFEDGEQIAPTDE